MPITESAGVLRLRPTFKPRMSCFGKALIMIGLGIIGVVKAWPKTVEYIAMLRGTADGSMEVYPGPLAIIWGCVVFCACFTLWLLWAMTDASKRNTVEVGEQALIWRPQLGFSKRIVLDSITTLEEVHGGLAGARLRICYGTEGKRKLDLPKNLYLPPDWTQLRKRLDPGHATRAAAAAVANAAERAATDED